MTLSESEVNHFLATISLRLRQFLDVKTTLQEIANETHCLLKCDRVLICRFEPDWRATVIIEAISKPHLSVLGKEIDNSCFESTWIEKYQQGITCNDNVIGVQTDESHRELLQYFGVEAHLVTPILQPKLEEDEIVVSELERDSLALASHQPHLWGLLIAHQWDKLNLYFDEQDLEIEGKRNKKLEKRAKRSVERESQTSNKPQIFQNGNTSQIATLASTEYQQPLKWYDSEIDLFKQVADKIAIATQTAELLESRERELREKREAQKQTQKIRKFLQTAIDRLPIAVYVRDASQNNFGQFKLWNQATESIFKLETAKFGKTTSDYFPLKQAKNFLQPDLTVLENGKIALEEECIEQVNGELKIVHKINIPLNDRDRQPKYLLCIAEDITNRKKAARELQQKTAELAAFSDHLKQLHRLNTTTYQSFEELLRDYLHSGCQMFNCLTGAVGIVKNDIYTIHAIKSNIEALYPKMQIPWEDTYCSEAVKQRKTITYHHIGQIKHLCSSPLYKNFKFESYIGTPIFVDGSIYGTLCFLSEKARKAPFSDREKETIEMMAQSIGRAISRDRVEQKRQQAEARLSQTKKELEIRVLQRTAQLELANICLQEELQEREQTQFALSTSQNSLKESERRWRSLLNNVRLLVVGIDNKGKVDYVNPYFLELTGYTHNETIGRDWIDYFVHPRNKNEAQQIYQDLMKFDYCCTHQYHQTTILNKYREAKTIAWNSTQLRNFQGIPTGIMCIGEDITQRQAIEKMKDEFISVVSHELRTPLTSIRGALGLLSTGVLKNDQKKAEKVTKIAAESTEHLVRLVDNILQLEKLESGEIELVIQKIKVSSLISQAINRVQIIANKEGINLQTTNLDGIIWGDGDRLIQVLTNLLSNAIKFSESGSTVWLNARFERSADNPLEQNIIFTIRDRGRGIPADRLDNIFERFHQVDASDSRRKGGTGLGLAICRSIVRQHGGKIWVQSVYGEGSTFYFKIPVSPP